jgi:glutamine synthetase adenylyltransferase
MPGGNTRTTVFSAPHPPYAASASGATVTDVEGRQRTDFVNNYTALIHGHAHPQLRTAHTLAVLNRLTALGILEEEQSALLRRNYFFLRRIESVLRRVDNTSASKISVDDREQLRLARRLGFPTAIDFLKTYRHATRKMRETYDQLFPSG